MHDKVVTVLPHAGHGDDAESLNLIDVLAIFARQRKVIVAVFTLTMIVAVAAAFLMKPFFVSTAVILPPQQASSAASMMLSQLGGLSAAGGLAGLKNPNEIYIGMLQSRSIGDRLITEFKLQERYDETTMDETRKEFLKKTTFASGKDGMIRISVEDNDPRFAAQLANAYVEQLIRLTRTLAVTEAARRRLYFEGQLKTVKNQLADAEVAMRKMQETTGMLQLDAQVKSLIANEAQLQGMIAAKEVQLGAMRSFATVNNPAYVRLQEEVNGLNAQLGKLKKGQESSQGDAMMATRKIPEVGVEYIRSLREVKYFETMFEMMAKQYELAKIDESKDSSVIQLLDSAVAPEKKSGPNRGRLLLGGLFGGLVLAAIIALLRDSYLRMRNDVANEVRWAGLRQARKQ
jgi:tyrosine-protein kinase Etk/Wzc